MRKVLLDANFLILPFESGADIFEQTNQLLGVQHSFFTTKSVVLELQNFTTGTDKKAIASKSALAMIGTKKITVLMDSGNADDSILSLAKKHHFIVCTNDAFLRLRLKKEKLPTITMRSHRLALL
ncbi:hypothetical protein J4441_02650 [Candidatus Micrarchaeota archaeon]|nr:hypothetical protein [Candidatus Micrarchaeota archaeon]